MAPKATDQRSMLAGGMDSLERFAARQIKRRGLKDNFYAVDLGRLHALYQVRRAAWPCSPVLRTLCLDAEQALLDVSPPQRAARALVSMPHSRSSGMDTNLLGLPPRPET
jgi:hypothetical protein